MIQVEIVDDLMEDDKDNLLSNDAETEIKSLVVVMIMLIRSSKLKNGVTADYLMK